MARVISKVQVSNPEPSWPACYSNYDRFIQREPCECVHASVNFFFKKTSPQKLLTGFLPVGNLHEQNRWFRIINLV